MNKVGGGGGGVLDWIKTYLRDRKQFVKLGEYSSLCLSIACDIPRGQYWVQSNFSFI